jgi:hypothetical protein
MARRGTTRAMSDAHEEYLVEVLGGRMTRGSGNQPANPLDGRHAHLNQSFAFAWDGKSTMGQSLSISRATWDQIEEDAHGERPLMPLRFYDTDRLKVGLDLVVLRLDDFAEMLDRLRGEV